MEKRTLVQMIYGLTYGIWALATKVSVSHRLAYPDIVDIKPVNMEELTEVITAAQFHPTHCNELVYSSSKGTIKLADMRESALCDRHAKCKFTDGDG